MVETLIEAGLRCGVLIALEPRHIDFLRRTLAVEETIVRSPRSTPPQGLASWPDAAPKPSRCCPRGRRLESEDASDYFSAGRTR